MRKIDKLKNILKINESIQIDNKQLNENENGFGTNLRSLLDGEIAIAMKNMDLMFNHKPQYLKLRGTGAF